MPGMRTRQTKDRYMGTYRLGLLSAGLAVWVLFLDLSLSVARIAAADSGSQATPTAPADRLLAVQKRICCAPRMERQYRALKYNLHLQTPP